VSKKREIFPELQPRRTLSYREAELEQSSTRNVPLPSRAIEFPGLPQRPLKIALLPDAQVAPGRPIDHLVAYGNYIAAKQPDVVVCIGDFADLPSLSTHDEPGSIQAEGRRYADDLDSVHGAMAAFMEPIRKVEGYHPKLVLTLGNHEDRIDRAIARDPQCLDGKIGMADLRYKQFGWTVVPFLQPVSIGGVLFCHYFPAGVMGRALTTAAGIIRKYHQSAVAGHLQGRDIAYGKHADGTAITAIISGSFYQHDEAYLTPLANAHWRGAWFFHEVRDGQFDEMALSIDFLKRKFA
jgi:hypothetical protein